jgi:hypothetical protein
MNDEDVKKVLQLQKIRRVVVYGALALLVLSFFQHITPLVYLRSALWGAAGVISILEYIGLKKVGQAAGNAIVNALLYFGVAILPVYFGR